MTPIDLSLGQILGLLVSVQLICLLVAVRRIQSCDPHPTNKLRAFLDSEFENDYKVVTVWFGLALVLIIALWICTFSPDVRIRTLSGSLVIFSITYISIGLFRLISLTNTAFRPGVRVRGFLTARALFVVFAWPAVPRVVSAAS